MKMIHILSADDDKHIRELLHYHLQKEGFKVFEAEDGKVAQDVLEKENIHLAILDIMMPFVDVSTLCEEILKYHDL
ncbi:response regulator, partial [Bacillus cereus]|nr:response regulator [Bacillus cereus]